MKDQVLGINSTEWRMAYISAWDWRVKSACVLPKVMSLKAVL